MLEILFSFSILLLLVSFISVKLAQVLAILMCLFLLVNLFMGD